MSWARTKSRATAAPRGSERRADGFERIAGAGVDCVRDTEPTRAGQLGVVDVAADDPGRRDRAQDLHGHLAQPAETDHDHGAVGREQRQRRLDGVVGREACDAQRRGDRLARAAAAAAPLSVDGHRVPFREAADALAELPAFSCLSVNELPRPKSWSIRWRSE